jgi:hypothetical protein
MECLDCKKEVPQTKGKREKKFCNSTCRSNYWQKQGRLQVPKEIADQLSALPQNMIILDNPAIYPDWTRRILAYCDKQSLTPDDLIQFHKEGGKKKAPKEEAKKDVKNDSAPSGESYFQKRQRLNKG